MKKPSNMYGFTGKKTIFIQSSINRKTNQTKITIFTVERKEKEKPNTTRKWSLKVTRNLNPQMMGGGNSYNSNIIKRKEKKMKLKNYVFKLL